MKTHAAIMLIALPILLSLPGSFPPDSYGNESNLADDCEARCAALDGEGRYRCLKTCVDTKRRNEPAGKDDVKGRMDTCENACADLAGLDKIKCIRICLDSKKERKVIKKDDLKKESDDPCETRCSVLSGVSKHQCMARCEKESRFDRKDATRVHKK